MSRSRLFSAALIWCLSASTLPAFAWSFKEHIQLTRLAAESLIADPSTPPAMRDWLKAANRGGMDLEGEKDYFLHQRIGTFPRGADGLCFWATMPDLDKGGGPGPRKDIEPFGLPEAQLHFVDLEYFHPDPAKHGYKHDLSHKPKLEDFPRNMKDPRWQQAGMLPFRVEDCYRKLVDNLKAGRLVDKDGQYPRDEHAEKWAGYLAHYLEDSTQPQHATVDYQSRAYFGKNLRPPNIHWCVEGLLMDDDKDDHMALREEFLPLFGKAMTEFKDPIDTKDLWIATLQTQLQSYDALPLIGQAAMAGYKMTGTPEAPEGHPSAVFDADAFFHFTGKVDGQEMTVLEMKARQLTWAIQRVEHVWRQAWDEANAIGK